MISLGGHRWSGQEPPALLSEGLCLVGGRWVAGDSGRTAIDDNPSTEAILAEVCLASDHQVDAAVAAARAQVDGGAWSLLTRADRRRIMQRMVELLDKHRVDLSDILVNEIGCPISLATSAQVGGGDR